MSTSEQDLPISRLGSLVEKPEFGFLNGKNLKEIQQLRIAQPGSFANEKFFQRVLVAEETQVGNPQRLNEDALMNFPLGPKRALFSVLDGASSQKEIPGLAEYGITGAFYISHLTSFGFPQSDSYRALCEQEHVTAGDVMRAVNTWLRSELSKIPGVDYADVLTVPGMAATFAVVNGSEDEISIAHVADTVGIAVYVDGQYEIVTVNQNDRFDAETLAFAAELALTCQCSLAQVMETPVFRDQIKAKLRDSFRRKINTPGGCGILNGMPELVDNNLIYETTVPITSDLAHLLLLSDGAVLPYAYSDRDIRISLALLVLDAIHASTGDMEFLWRGINELMNDPLFQKIPRLKNRDDATFVEITFEHAA